MFNQSSVKEHTELAWIFNCVCRIGWLNRMTQFKEKARKQETGVTVGLFTYPTLMAADILIYDPEFVSARVSPHAPPGDKTSLKT